MEHVCRHTSSVAHLPQRLSAPVWLNRTSRLPFSGGRATTSNRKASTHVVASSLGAGAVVVGNGWSLWALLAACAAAGQVLEQRTVCGRYTSAPLLTMVLGIALASTGATLCSRMLAWHETCMGHRSSGISMRDSNSIVRVGFLQGCVYQHQHQLPLIMLSIKFHSGCPMFVSVIQNQQARNALTFPPAPCKTAPHFCNGMPCGALSQLQV